MGRRKLKRERTGIDGFYTVRWSIDDFKGPEPCKGSKALTWIFLESVHQRSKCRLLVMGKKIWPR
jgi:hypothetical protein